MSSTNNPSPSFPGIVLRAMVDNVRTASAAGRGSFSRILSTTVEFDGDNSEHAVELHCWMASPPAVGEVISVTGGAAHHGDPTAPLKVYVHSIEQFAFANVSGVSVHLVPFC